MLKKFHSDIINVTKNVLFFLLRSPAHRSFIFNLQFLYELKHMVHLWFLSYVKNFENLVTTAWIVTDLRTNFINLENQSFEYVTFS